MIFRAECDYAWHMHACQGAAWFSVITHADTLAVLLIMLFWIAQRISQVEWVGDNRHTAPRAVLAAIEAIGFQCVADFSAGANNYIRTQGGVAGINLLAVVAGDGACDIPNSVGRYRSLMVAGQRRRAVHSDFCPPLSVCGADNVSAGCSVCSWESASIDSGIKRAGCLKAASNIGGSSFPRFSARRNIPRQAVALKKYRCGSAPVSKTSDNEHATAPLWNSKVLSVKNSVGEPIPEFCQHPEEGSKIFSSVR